MEISWAITDNFRLASPFIAIGAGLAFVFLWWLLTRRKETVKHSHLELLGRDKFRQNIISKWIFIFPLIALISSCVYFLKKSRSPSQSVNSSQAECSSKRSMSPRVTGSSSISKVA